MSQAFSSKALAVFTALSMSCVLWDSQPTLEAACGATTLAPVGSRCACDDDCASGECITEASGGWPGGMCTSVCVSDQDCGDDNLCLEGACWASCRRPADCEAGRSCVPANASDPSGDRFCLPTCASNGDCTSRTCNPWSGQCLDADSEPVGGGVAEACDADTDCKSGDCVAGGCGTLCSVSEDSCPDDAACVPIAADQGTCALPCAEQRDCRGLGWSACQPTEPDGMHCLP